MQCTNILPFIEPTPCQREQGHTGDHSFTSTNLGVTLWDDKPTYVRLKEPGTGQMWQIRGGLTPAEVVRLDRINNTRVVVYRDTWGEEHQVALEDFVDSHDELRAP